MESDESRRDEVAALCKTMTSELFQKVFKPLSEALKADKLKREALNPAFPVPTTIRYAFLDKGLAIEYVGPGHSSGHIDLNALDDGRTSFFDFLGIESGTPMAKPFYYGLPSWNTNFYLGDSIDRLNDLEFDWASSNDLTGINGYNDLERSEQYTFYSNVTFFWTDTTGQLRVRHIDYLEFFPSPGEDYFIRIDDLRFDALRTNVATLEMPTFDQQLHRELNSFIELIHQDDVAETTITTFLTHSPELLELAFSSKRVHSQVEMKWQYDKGIPNLKPDFLVERMDGFCDIIEFKLPNLKAQPTVGTPQRRHPSFEVDSAIAQLDMYEEWVGQDINRAWLESERSIRVLHPQRWLVIGTSKTFPSAERQRLRRTRNTQVYTYDEFIGLIRHHLYRVR